MLKENLIMLRTIHGFSQEEIAEKINISRQAYAKWESGATIPDIQKCGLLAQVYGVTVDSLLKDEKVEGVGTLAPAPVGKSIWGTVTVRSFSEWMLPPYLALPSLITPPDMVRLVYTTLLEYLIST